MMTPKHILLKNLMGPFPHPFKRFMKNRKISMKAMANHLNVSQTTLWRWLNGINDLPDHIKEEIKIVLNRGYTNENH